MAAPASAAEIVLKDGRTISASSIVEASTDTVKYKMGGSTQSISASKVESVFPSHGALGTVLRYLRSGEDLERILKACDRVRGGDQEKGFAQYFRAEAYLQNSDVKHGLRELEQMASRYSRHFYAPVALYRASQITSGRASMGYLRKLASGSYGRAWKETGDTLLALRLLAAGKASQAKPVFQRLSSSASDENTKLLARCGLAHCKLLAGDKSVDSTFRTIAKNEKAPAAARGYAWTGLGLCLKGSDDDAALLALLRGTLLYTSNPQRALAGAEAAKLSKSKGLGGGRLLSLGQRAPFGDYTGDQPLAEVLRRSLQASAHIVKYFAPKLLSQAKDKAEQAEIEFLGADALKYIAKAKNDPAMLRQYEAKIKKLQQKYPDNPRAGLAGINAIEAGIDRANALIGKGHDTDDPSQKAQLLKDGRALLKKTIESARTTMKGLHKKARKMLEKEGTYKRAALIPEKEKQERMRAENERDLTTLFLANAYLALARSYKAGEGGEADGERKSALNDAKQTLMLIIEGDADRTGTNNNYLRNFASLSLVEVMTEAGGEDLQMAIDLGSGLCDTTLWYDREHPPKGMPKSQVDKDVEHIQNVVVQAHVLTIKAMLKAKQGEAAYRLAKGIDGKEFGRGWRNHPMALLLTFERAKAMAGAGRGAEGAADLYRIVKKEEVKKDKGDEAARARWVDACKAMSELSDITGGEVYSPAIQYYTGFGYWCRGKLDQAITAYKGVLTAARSRQEREMWVPKAVTEVGNRLFQQERFLEAALAYQTVFVEFPEHPKARSAIKYAITAAKKAIDQYGESDSPGAISAFYKKLQGSIVGDSAADIKYKLILDEAKQKHIKQKWVQAAEKYLEIPEYSTDPKTKKKVPVKYYSNALANAGYCYSQAYKKRKRKEYIDLARKNLKKAADVSAAQNDRESQALASFYLGQIEREVLDNPKQALVALEVFDGALSSTTKYIVRARYQQAMAVLDIGNDNAVEQAEAYFNKVENRKKDSFYGKFAYAMVVKLRNAALKTYRKHPNQIDAPRRMRAKAGRFAKLFLESMPFKEVRSAVLFYLADVLFEGGQYGDAKRVYAHLIQTTKAPKGGIIGARKMRAVRRLDNAKLYLGVCQAKTGQYEDALKTLLELRKVVYIRAANNAIVGRGLLKSRGWSDRAYSFTRDGRDVNAKVMLTKLDFGGSEATFFDAHEARSSERFKAVKGDDPTASWTQSDVVSLEMLLKRDYYLVDAVAEAAWGRYQESKDKTLLAGKDEGSVTWAMNELLYVLKYMDDGGYRALIVNNQYEPDTLTMRSWGAKIRYLKVKLAREMWGEVISELEQMKLLKTWGPKTPASIDSQLKKIEAEAKSKAQG